MKLKLIILIILLQQPFNITEHISDMQGGWSIGNGCDEHFTDWATVSSVETNGHPLEVMNGWLDIQGQIQENGVNQDVVQMIVDGRVILRCTESMISVNTTLSTIEEDFQVAKVFPNPFGSQITIKGNGIKRLIIYDINGKKIIERPTTFNTTVLQLGYLQSGLYFLQVHFDLKVPVVVRIIKNSA